jgi:hypothetical protein
MLRKSLILSAMAALLAVGLLFTGCPTEVKEVPVEVIVEVEKEGQGTGGGGPGQNIEIPVFVDKVVDGALELKRALESSDPNLKEIALIGSLGGIIPPLENSSLEIPAGKTLWLYTGLRADCAFTINVKGKIVVAANGILIAARNRQIAVTEGGLIEVQAGTLVVDAADSVNGGESPPRTVLGTPKVKIDNRDSTLYYNDTLTKAVIAEYFPYITKGNLSGDTSDLKLTELIGLVSNDPGKVLVAKAGVKEDDTDGTGPESLIIPANAALTSYDTSNPGDTDYLSTVTSLTVLGSLNVTTGVFDLSTPDPAPPLAGLKTLTLEGSLETDAELTLITTLTIPAKGKVRLDNATFDNLETLVIKEGGSLTASREDLVFTALKNLTLGAGAVFDVSKKSGVELGSMFPGVTTLTVNGTFKVNNGENVGTPGGNIFGALDSLTVNGTFETDAVAGFASVTKLTVNSGASFKAGGGTLDAVTTLDLAKGGVLIADAAAWASVTTLTLNGDLVAPNGTFGNITTVSGTGSLTTATESGAVPGGATAATSKALILFNSSLSTVALTSDADIEVPVTVSGKTRKITLSSGDFLNKITVEQGGVLELAYDAAPGGESGEDITVLSGGKIVFSGKAAPVGNVLINDGTAVIAGTKGSTTVTASLAIAEGKKLVVGGNATLRAANLELKGVTYVVPIRAEDYAGSETPGLVISDMPDTTARIEATVARISDTDVHAGLKGTFKIAPNGYIKDTTQRSPWTIDGGSGGGNFVYSGGTGGIITLGLPTTGPNGITTNETGLVLEILNPDGTIQTDGQGEVTFTGDVKFVANSVTDSLGPTYVTLKNVIIDLTDEGSVVVEANAELRLTGAVGALLNNGAITTNSTSTDVTRYVGIVGAVRGIGALPGGYTTAATIGRISLPCTIKKNKTFSVGAAVSGVAPITVN